MKNKIKPFYSMAVVDKIAATIILEDYMQFGTK